MKTMNLTFVNVGYGEAILGECPAAGRRPFRFLIDGGSARASEYEDCSSGRIPLPDYLGQAGIDYLDLLISTHTHEDHICAQLQAARLLPPTEFWQSLPPDFHQDTRYLDPSLGQNLSQTNFLSALNDYASLCQLVRNHGGTVRQVLAGAEFTPCPGLNISVLGPSPAAAEELEARARALYAASDSDTFLHLLTDLDGRMNNYSVILRLDWHGTRVLLPGDTNRLGYGGIPSEALRAHIFKVGHHGQIDGADDVLLHAVQPEAVVCCASSDRRYNSAHPDLMAEIADYGADRFFSDCPPVPGMMIPPHNALVFTIGEGGSFQTEYL